MRNSTKFWAVVTMLDSTSDDAVREAAIDRRPATGYQEVPYVTRQLAPAPQRSRRDGYPAAGMVFFCIMMLAATAAALYEPLPRAQLIVLLATSVPATLTAVLAWRRSR
jgi:hypothetical protein